MATSIADAFTTYHPRTLKVLLKVEHRGESKMVGKIFTVDVPDDGLVSVFYHEAHEGTQEHIALDCPGGIDWAVIETLEHLGIEHIHHYDASTQRLYCTTRRELIERAVEAHWDGRSRLFLPRRAWTVAPCRWYAVPWVTKEMTIKSHDRERMAPRMF